VAIAAEPLVGRKRLSLADLVEDAARAIRDAAVQLPLVVAVERAAGRVRRVASDARELERLAVVEARVATAVLDRDGVVLRHLVEIVDVQLPLVFYFRVVEE